MKDPTLRQYAVTLASALTFSTASLWAQQTPPAGLTPESSPAAPRTPVATEPSTSSSPAPDADTIQLSPFEVTSSSNLGYQETETLAGTRIRTSLRDVGSAISVVNQQFLRDIGATNSQTLLQYTTSTEVGGPQGNFGGLGDGANLNDADQRLRPSGTTRVRGLDSADNTRNFFLTDIPWDSYNTSRIDIQRGANSILFGNGSGAGIINGEIDGATLGANRGTIEARYGSFGSYRASLNLNRDLIPKQLAVRFASVHDKDYYRQDPAYNRDRRNSLAARWEPKFLKKGSASTSLKASFEKGKVDANRPRTTAPLDAISPWFITSSSQMISPTPVNASGTTLLGTILPMISHDGYDPFVTNITDTGLIAANPTRRDIGARASNTVNYERWLGSGTPGIVGDWYDGFGAIYADPASSTLSNYVPGGVGIGSFLFSALGASGARDGGINGLRSPQAGSIQRFSDAGGYAQAANFLYQGQGVYRSKTLTDPSVFDFYNKLLDGPNKREEAEFDALNIALDQTFFNDKAGFQIALDKQTYDEARTDMLGGSPTITIDVMRYLPVAVLNSTSGHLEPVLNPNFGRPMVVASSGGNFARETTRETRRVTPFIDLNFKEITGKDNWLTNILGRHTFTGLYEETEVERESLSWTRYTLDESTALALYGTTGSIAGTARRINTVSYLGPSLLGRNLAGANLSNLTARQQPASGRAWYFNSTYSSTAPAPGAAYTSTNGLFPSQVALTGSTQSENPRNYVGYTNANSINVANADFLGRNALATNSNKRRDETKSMALVDQWKLLNGYFVVTGGLRRDEVEGFFPGTNGNRATDSTGRVIWTAPFEYGATPNSSYESKTLKSIGLVAHSPEFINRHLPFGLKLSAFYNQSENFRPESRFGILGQSLSPPTGETKDFGVLINALNNRVSIKINRYETKVKDASLGDNSVATRIGDEVNRSLQFALSVINRTTNGYRYTNTANAADTNLYPYQPATGTAATWTTADWQNAQTQALADAAAILNNLPSQEFLTAWGIRPSSFNTTTGDIGAHVIPSGFALTGDTQSKGTEIEIYLRPTNNWNITANIAKTSAQRLNLAGSVASFIEQRWNLYNTTAAGSLRWFGGGQGSVSSSTGLARLGRNAWAFYQTYRSQEGNDVPELRPWRFNVVSSYNLTRGPVKGTFIGGSYRWADENVIGYGVTERTPSLSASNPAIGYLDVNKPFHGPTEDAIDLWIGYNRKIWRGLDWRIQLNVRNAFDKVRLVPVNTNPDGSIGSYRIAEGATWELTNSIKF